MQLVDVLIKMVKYACIVVKNCFPFIKRQAKKAMHSYFWYARLYAFGFLVPVQPYGTLATLPPYWGVGTIPQLGSKVGRRP